MGTTVSARSRLRLHFRLKGVFVGHAHHVHVLALLQLLSEVNGRILNGPAKIENDENHKTINELTLALQL